ncbi:putative DND microRNA-mediated repression inhibitor 1 [Trypoxylus dichotomus]
MEKKMFLIMSIAQLRLKVTLQHQSRMESTEVLAIRQKSKSALVWESFCEAVTSLATSIDCYKTLVRVTHGIVTDSSIILLEVLVPGPRGNIPQDCFDDELLPLFWNIPELYTFRFMFDFRRLCRGFTFAKYKSLDSVRKACTLCDGFQIRFNCYHIELSQQQKLVGTFLSNRICSLLFTASVQDDLHFGDIKISASPL